MTFVGMDDILLSVREHVLNKQHTIKTDTGYSTSSLASFYPNLSVVISGLEYNPSSLGPRIGIEISGEVDSSGFFGDAKTHRWTLVISVESYIRGVDGTISPSSSILAMSSLSSSMRQIFSTDTSVPINIWGPSGIVSTCGTASIPFDVAWTVVDRGNAVMTVDIDKIVDV